MTLTLRHRLFLLISALLYMGPLVAGLAGFGWQMIPVFTAIFLMWLVVMKPAMWPKTAAEWQTPAMIGKFILWAVIQAVLVGFCFSIGRGIGFMTTGMFAAVPIWGPPLMSILAIVLARSVWNPTESAEMDAFLDGAIGEINGINAALTADAAKAEQLRHATIARAKAACAPFLTELAALPETTPDTVLEIVLTRARAEIHPMTLLDALAERAEAGQITSTQRRAHILLATDIPSADRHLGNGAIAETFDIAGEDANRLYLFANRTAALLKAFPAAMMDTPTSARVRSVSGRHPQAEAALLALASQMDTLDDD